MVSKKAIARHGAHLRPAWVFPCSQNCEKFLFGFEVDSSYCHTRAFISWFSTGASLNKLYFVDAFLLTKPGTGEGGGDCEQENFGSVQALRVSKDPLGENTHFLSCEQARYYTRARGIAHPPPAGVYIEGEL